MPFLNLLSGLVYFVNARWARISVPKTDVALAVDTATAVAKECADIVLLKQDLGVIINGIEGRTSHLPQY